MKKIFILLLSALLPLTTTAADKVEIDGMWYTLDETQQTAAVAKCPNPGYIGNIVIPESVTTGGVTYAVKAIDNEAFSGCSALVSVSMGNSVETIGLRAFAYSAIISVNIGDGVKSMDEFTFFQCNRLTTVTIGSGLAAIPRSAFNECPALKTVIIGSGVTSIGQSAFFSCSSLADVYCLPTTAPSTVDGSFESRYMRNVILHFPGAADDTYKVLPWSGCKAYITRQSGELEKCAKPSISLKSGKVSFTCTTDGVEFLSDVQVDGTGSYGAESISIPKSFKITVVATKKGCYMSDVATRSFFFTGAGLTGDVNNDGKVNVADHVRLTDIIMDQE